ncbi:MAG: START domain-containing protein [Polyangiales bacterium]
MSSRWAMSLLVLAISAQSPSLVVRAEPPPASAQPASKDTGWEQIDDDEGIKVWKHEVPGNDLPGFRGQVVVDAAPRAIIDVIEDWKRHTEWMHRCAESTELKDLGVGTKVMYNRTNPPWPVWDRDVILETKLDISEDKNTITLSFRNIKSDLRPVPDKVIRMPRLLGYYRLVRLGEKQTKVTYQVEADPGGSLPRWLAVRVARDLPFETLSRLRARVRKAGK